MEDHAPGTTKEKVYEVFKAIMRLRGLVSLIDDINVTKHREVLEQEYKLINRFIKRDPARKDFKFWQKLYGDLEAIDPMKKNEGTK